MDSAHKNQDKLISNLSKLDSTTEAFQQVLDSIVESCEFTFGILFTVEYSDLWMKITSDTGSRSFFSLLEKSVISLKIPINKNHENPITKALSEDKILEVENLADLFRGFLDQKDLEKVAELMGIKDSVVIPMVHEGGPIGALLVSGRSIDRPKDFEILKLIASFIGATIIRNKEYKILEETYQKDKDMLDILGHELRTPLTIAKNASTILKKKHEQGKLEKQDLDKYLPMAEENLEREAKLLETLLSTTKIDNQALDLIVERVDLIDVVNDSLDAFGKKAAEKGLQVKFERPRRAYVQADRNRMQEVADNLLDNAIKYTHKGSVDILIDQKDRFIELAVKDTGVGISAEDIKNLGQKFYRSNNYLESSKNAGMDIIRPGGTGLGLYVTFNLVKQMGGKIEVESEVEKGSTFKVIMPAYFDDRGPESPRKGRRMTVFEKFEKKKRKRKEEKEGAEVSEI